MRKIIINIPNNKLRLFNIQDYIKSRNKKGNLTNIHSRENNNQQNMSMFLWHKVQVLQ